jgi:hypothetical protein
LTRQGCFSSLRVLSCRTGDFKGSERKISEVLLHIMAESNRLSTGRINQPRLYIEPATAGRKRLNLIEMKKQPPGIPSLGFFLSFFLLFMLKDEGGKVKRVD